MQSHRRQTGFTMVELLVAVLILSLIGLFINQLFMHTQKAVSTGIRTGELLIESESIGDQIARDASIMLPPRQSPPTAPDQPAGFLVIIQKRYVDDPTDSGIYQEADHDVRLRLGEPLLHYYKSGGATEKRWVSAELATQKGADANSRFSVRSDQLLFFVGSTDGSAEIRSLTPQSSNTFGSDAKAPYARIAYGHIARTARDGSYDGNLGDQGYNYYANQWMLGRQQLLLHPDPAAAGIDIYAQNDPPTTYAAVTGAVVRNSGGRPLYFGLTDVADIKLTTGIPTPASEHGVIESLDYSNLENTIYPYTFAAARLRANPVPQGLTAEQIAQTHALLAQNVSDFIVEFAGNYDGMAGIDRDTEFPASANSTNADTWATDKFGWRYYYAGDNIKWYSHYPNVPGDPDYDSTQPASYPVPTQPSQPYGFSTSGADPNTAYYDNSPAPLSYPNADAIFVFRHDDSDPTTSKWPYLIRIRYRMHDAQGRIQSTQGGLGHEVPPDYPTDPSVPQWTPTPGRWFEHIIPVARPTP